MRTLAAVARSVAVAICVLTHSVSAVLVVHPQVQPQVTGVESAAFMNADVPYGCAPYNVSAPLPFVQVALIPGCALSEGSVVVAGTSNQTNSSIAGAPFVGYLNFQDAVQNAGCHSYADLVHNILPQLISAGLVVLVVSQAEAAEYLPGFRDFYGPDHNLYAANSFAITVVTATDGDVLSAWFTQAALNSTNTTVTVSSQPSEWQILSETPGVTAGQVILSAVSFGLALFVLVSQLILLAKVGLWHYQLTLANQIQWCLFITFVIYGIYTLLAFELRIEAILGTPVFATARVFEYIAVLTGFTAFCLMLSGWARAITALPGSKMRPYLWIFKLMLFIISILLIISLVLVVVADFASETNTPLASAQSLTFMIVGAIIIILAISMLGLGARMIHLLLFDHRDAMSNMSPQRKTLLIKITALMTVSAVGLIGLCVDTMASGILYRTPSVNVSICVIEFVFAYVIFVTILATLRYDAFDRTSNHQSSSSGTGPHSLSNSNLQVAASSTSFATKGRDDTDPDELILSKMHRNSQSPYLVHGNDDDRDSSMDKTAPSAMDDVNATILALAPPLTAAAPLAE